MTPIDILFSTVQHAFEPLIKPFFPQQSTYSVTQKQAQPQFQSSLQELQSYGVDIRGLTEAEALQYVEPERRRAERQKAKVVGMQEYDIITANRHAEAAQMQSEAQLRNMQIQLWASQSQQGTQFPTEKVKFS